MTCECTLARDRHATLTLTAGSLLDPAQFVYSFGRNTHPTDGVVPTVSAPEIVFVNNDDDSGTRAIDCEECPPDIADEEVAPVRVEVPAGWDGVLLLDAGESEWISGL